MNGQEERFELDPESGSVSIGMLQYMHPMIVFIISWSNLWCIDNGITPTWTSWMRTPEQNKALGATQVHVYRAADLSLRSDYGWNTGKRTLFEKALRAKFKKVGAIVSRGGRSAKVVIKRHDIGHGDHFHIQVNPFAKLSDLA